MLGKLVELLGRVQQMGVIYRESQMDERYPTIEQIRNTEVASYLIDSGVTVQELDGCDFCKKFDFAGARAEVNKYGAHIRVAICNTKFPDEEQFKFCPMCGRKLPQPPKGE